MHYCCSIIDKLIIKKEMLNNHYFQSKFLFYNILGTIHPLQLSIMEHL